MGTDSVVYHQIAVKQARVIHEFGWGKWLLSPAGQTPAGIASFFYAFLIPKPWVLLPANAALYAGSVCLLIKILSLFEKTSPRWIRVVAISPFLIFPSAAIIYGQLLKDGYFIFGNLLFIYSWLRWLQQRDLSETGSLREFAFCFLSVVLAYLMVWVVRPYWGPIFFLWSLVFFILITFNQGLNFSVGKRSWKKKGIFWIGSLVLVLFLGSALQQKKLPRSMISEVPGQEQLKVEFSWQPSPWLPASLDSRLQSLAFSRKAFLVKYPQAGTNVDRDVNFQKAGDILGYLPRAFYVGFFMPTLALTFREGLNPGGTWMRWITGFEMILLCLCYPFLVLAGWAWRKKLEYWTLMIWAFGGILVYTLVSPNIGALYRFRYGFIMTLAALGIFKALMFIPKGKRPAVE